jgi:hypothetical protein
VEGFHTNSSSPGPPGSPTAVISPIAGALLDQALEERPDNTTSETQSIANTDQPNINLDIGDFQEAQVRSQPYQDEQVFSGTLQSAPASTQTLFQELLGQNQSTQRASSVFSSPGHFQSLLLPAELTSSSAPQPPTIGPDSLATNPAHRLQSPSRMPETRRSLRGSGASSGPSKSSGRGGSSNSSQNSKNLRSIRAEENAKKKEKGEKEKRDLAAKKEEQNREREAREAAETAAASSTSASQESEDHPPAIPADDDTTELIVPRDADGNAKLADRIPPGSADEEMESNLSLDNEEILKVTALADQPSTEEHGVSSLRPMEFDVTLPLAANARDQYRQTVKYNQALIERFTGKNWSQDPTVLPQAEQFIETMRDIATHVDLTNDTTASQSSVEPGLVLEWDRSVSTKFKFLHLLLDELHDQNLHIIIVSRPGKLLDILQNFLRGCKINCSRAGEIDTTPPVESTGSLQITILPSTGQGSDAIDRPAQLVLIMDQFVDTRDQSMLAFRRHPTQADRLAPVVSLVVANSVDHIERTLIPTHTGVDRLRILVRCITKLRKEAGRTDGNIPSIEESASEVAKFITANGTAEQWHLPKLGVLDNNDAQELSQGIVTMKSAASSDSEKSAKVKAALKSAQKRRLDHIQDEEGDPSKKMRMTPQADNDASTTRISDSLAGKSSQLANAEEMLALRKVNEALEARAVAAEARSRDLEGSLDSLQLRFEDQTVEKRSLVRQLTEIRDASVWAEKRNAHNDETIHTLKTKNREMEEELTKARELLSNHHVPEVAELEKLRSEKVLAQEAQTKAEKDAAQKESLNGFLRQQYQDATARVVEVNQENDELLAKVKVLEKKASGEIAKVRQLHLDQQQRRLVAENTRLQQENRNLVAQIQRQADDLQTVRKSGIGTRASSAPRSPRVGPTISRGGSPAPAQRVGALKSNANL